MLKKRLIPCIVVKDGWAVQSIGFRRFLPIGHPAVVAEFLNRWGADEIVLQDISASRIGRGPDLDLIGAVAAKCFVPLTVAGGISAIEDVHAIIRRGGDKVAVNSAVVGDPRLVTEIAARFGNQCVIASIDVLGTGSRAQVMTHGGSRATRPGPAAWAAELQKQGAGEVLLNSIERDGSKRGYDLPLIEEMTRGVQIPVIACGGAGHPEHFVEVLRLPGVSAAAAANIFSFSEHSVLTIKAYLAQAGIEVRGETYADYSMHRFDADGRVAKQPDALLDRIAFEHVPEEVI